MKVLIIQFYSAWYCIQIKYKCWKCRNCHLLTFPFEENVCALGSWGVNIQPPNTACCNVCWKSAIVCCGGKYVPTASSALWLDMRSLLQNQSRTACSVTNDPTDHFPSSWKVSYGISIWWLMLISAIDCNRQCTTLQQLAS
jgi:hypothetical protein